VPMISARAAGLQASAAPDACWVHRGGCEAHRGADWRARLVRHAPAASPNMFAARCRLGRRHRLGARHRRPVGHPEADAEAMRRRALPTCCRSAASTLPQWSAQ
jgi:hypothetical protein